MNVKYLRRALIAFGLISLVVVGGPWLYVRWALGREWNVRSEDLRDALAEPSEKPESLLLVLALDGVPYRVMRELWEEGSFMPFLSPGRMVSTFPSHTRPSFSKILPGPNHAEFYFPLLLIFFPPWRWWQWLHDQSQAATKLFCLACEQTG